MKFGRAAATKCTFNTVASILFDCGDEHEQALVAGNRTQQRPWPQFAGKRQQWPLMALARGRLKKIAMRKNRAYLDLAEGAEHTTRRGGRVRFGARAFQMTGVDLGERQPRTQTQQRIANPQHVT